MLSRRAVIPLVTLALAAPARAQQPVQEYEPARGYSTFNAAVQLTGGFERGRELMLAWGRMATAGPRGAWMASLELDAGLSPGVHEFIEGVAAGPRLTLARAFPAQFISLGRRSRGEPYLLASAALYAAGDFRDDRTRWGGAPAVSAGLGLRVFSDAWNVDLSTFEAVLEKRYGVQDDGLRLYFRVGRATARRPRDRESPPPLVTPHQTRR
ncbi:MAG TPA: hypothetical protein VFJ82_22475 [Longimicrobium sp.]|nr:hypothetical protein [Longimicrobium sp.]